MISESTRELSWLLVRLGEAIETLGRKSGLSPRQIEMPSPPGSLDSEALERWLEAAASPRGTSGRSARGDGAGSVLTRLNSCCRSGASNGGRPVSR